MLDKTKKTILIISMILTAIGAINWGLTTVGTNLVSDYFPKGMQKITFFLIGLAGIITLIATIKWAMMKNAENFRNNCTSCGSKKENDDDDDEPFAYYF
jgi:uncharacterized membrane protein YuzA (DUF378 family)